MLGLWSIAELIIYLLQKFKVRQKKLRAIIQMTLRRRRRKKSLRTKTASVHRAPARLEGWASFWSHRTRSATNSRQSKQKRAISVVMVLERFGKWKLISFLYMQDIQSWSPAQGKLLQPGCTWPKKVQGPNRWLCASCVNTARWKISGTVLVVFNFFFN